MIIYLADWTKTRGN